MTTVMAESPARWTHRTKQNEILDGARQNESSSGGRMDLAGLLFGFFWMPNPPHKETDLRC